MLYQSSGCLFYPGILGYLIFWVQKVGGRGNDKEQDINVCNKSFGIKYRSKHLRKTFLNEI